MTGQNTFRGAVNRGRHDRLALLAVAGDILEHDDGIIDNNPTGQTQNREKWISFRL